jgi:hypothetical protein
VGRPHLSRWVSVAAVVGVAAVIGALISLDSGGSHELTISSKATLPTTTTTSTTTTTTEPPPTSIAPLAGSALVGEGQWTPAGRLVAGRPAVFVTVVRPPSGGPLVGVARLDTRLLNLVVYAGTQQPPGDWTARGQVATDKRPWLVAAFNGGFQFGSAAGGFYADGTASPALRDGAASFVVRTDGSADVVKWGRDATLTPDVSEVRQNLTLLVDGGAPTPLAASSWAWGATLGHTVATWRSAVGSDSTHHVYFVGGPGMTPAALASVLVAAGAERAMELDINPQWVFFAAYTETQGTKLLPAMNYSPDHVLSSDWRDFVAAFAKTP